jgi:hypothetical protein
MRRSWRLEVALPSCPILETDKDILPQKVSEAEQAVLARGRQLFYYGGTGEEQELLEDALYALRAFKSASEDLEDEIGSAALTLAA